MDDISLSVTGPFGSEMIPRGLYAGDAAEAAGIFGRVMSGEEELAMILGSHLNAPLPAPLGAAISMLVERARRVVQHASYPEARFGSTLDVNSYVREQLRNEFGTLLPAHVAYRAYEQWVRGRAFEGRGSRPVGVHRFVHAVSLRFERVTTQGGACFIDCALPVTSAPEDAAADAQVEDRS